MLRALIWSIKLSYTVPKIPPSQSPALVKNLTFFYYTTGISTHGNRRIWKNTTRVPPPPRQSKIDACIASLPPRFTSLDITSALARLHDPRICIPLLLHSIHHRPHLLRSGNADALSPFLVAVKQLGDACLYQDMDSVASLAFSFSSYLHLTEAFFNNLIHFYSKARWISRAVGVYKFMRSSKAPAAIRPTTRTFNLLFAALLSYHRGSNSYVRHLYMDALRSLFRQLLDSGLAPNIYSFNSMIKGYVLSLHVNDALRIFHQMVPVYGIEPDDCTYSYLIHGLCAQGRTLNARELYVEMKQKGLLPSRRACNSFVCVLAMDGEVDEAVAAMWDAVGMRNGPDFITCRTLVEEICRKQRVRDAVELLRDMKQKHVIDGRCYRDLLAGLEGEYPG